MKIFHFAGEIFFAGLLFLMVAWALFSATLSSPSFAENKSILDLEVPINSDSMVGSVAVPFNVSEKGMVYDTVGVALSGTWFTINSEHFAVSPNAIPLDKYSSFEPGKYYLVVPFVLSQGLDGNYSLTVRILETVWSPNPLHQYVIPLLILGVSLIAVSLLLFLPHKRLVAAILLIVLASAVGILAYRNYVSSQPPKEPYPTVYIQSDGLVEGSDRITSIDNRTYTLMDNLNASLVVEKDDIVVDGANHTIQSLGNLTGIDLGGRTNVTVKNLKIVNYETGIYLKNSTYITIAGNEIINCTSGIKMYESSRHSVVIGNGITNLRSQGGSGIDFWYASNNSIFDNKISNTLHAGILLDWFSENNSIVNNDIRGNSDGIIAGTALNNSIYHNNFVSNSYRHAIVYGPAVGNVWDNGYPSGGNYWSDYEGKDANGDGIGDTPYVIKNESYPIKIENIDRYPLMNQRF